MSSELLRDQQALLTSSKCRLPMFHFDCNSLHLFKRPEIACICFECYLGGLQLIQCPHSRVDNIVSGMLTFTFSNSTSLLLFKAFQTGQNGNNSTCFGALRSLCEGRQFVLHPELVSCITNSTLCRNLMIHQFLLPRRLDIWRTPFRIKPSTSLTQWMARLLIAICLAFTLPENWRAQFQSSLPCE